LSGLPDWARALGEPLFAGRIRAQPSDFCVTEILDLDFGGDGEHDWLWVEKSGANTDWVATQLAQHAGVSARDVGYAGLKDRHAVTRQWFSVRRPAAAGTDWTGFARGGVTILDVQRHRRKLRRGAHRGNRFRIAIRAALPARTDIERRLDTIAAGGVPNYFGEQRFGHGGGNIALGQAVLAGRRMSRNKRSLAISALRALDFNEQLSARVIDATWNRILRGDVANLDGSNSIFIVDDVDPELERRCEAMDIHPTGELPAYEVLRVDAARRPLRMRVDGLSWELAENTLWLEFALGRGCYATSLLREIAYTREEH